MRDSAIAKHFVSDRIVCFGCSTARVGKLFGPILYAELFASIQQLQYFRNSDMLENSTHFALECALGTGSMTALSIWVASNWLAIELHIAKWVSVPNSMTEAGIEKWNYLPLLFSFSLYAVAAQMKVKNKKKYGEMIIESNYSGAMRKSVMMYEVRIEKKKNMRTKSTPSISIAELFRLNVFWYFFRQQTVVAFAMRLWRYAFETY